MELSIVINTSTPALNDSATEDLNPFYFYKTVQFTVMSILFVAIVVGNSSVLFSIVCRKANKSRMNFFIVHLAIADLSVGLISVLTDIIWRLTVSWKAGNAACKIVRFMQAVVTYSSTYLLVALSIDRFDAITNPMNFSGSWKRARILVSMAWFLAALFSSPILVLYEEHTIKGRTQCWIDLGSPLHWQIYMSLVAITLFVIPAVVIAICYTVIVYTIWIRSKFIPRETHQANLLKSRLAPKQRGRCKRKFFVDGDRIDEPEIRRVSSRGIIPRAKIKTVKMTFVIVFVFILCWSPYIVFDVLQVFGQIPQTQKTIALATFIQSLAPLNSAANPVIYCLFSTRLCRSLRRVPPFSWMCCLLGQTSESSSLTDTTQTTSRPPTVRSQHTS